MCLKAYAEKQRGGESKVHEPGLIKLDPKVLHIDGETQGMDWGSY